MRSSLRNSALGLLAIPFLHASGSPFHKRAPAGQGWSLQSNTCPAGASSCGGSACCPSSSSCQAAGNGEVTACCPSSSNCVGDIEGDPTCADSAWSLWKGSYGNGFCCEVGMIGAYYNGESVAGKCVTSVPSGYTSAQLATQGTGSPSTPTTTPSSPTTTPSSPKSTTASPTSTSTSPTSTGSSGGSTPNPGRAVFAHYMVGTMTQDEANQDIQDGMAVGFDAFALNTHDITDSWALNSIGYLFNAADQYGFKLFMSFDMSWGTITPSDIPPFLQNYITHSSYYRVDGKPFVSTYQGATYSNDEWESDFRQPMVNDGDTPYFVPDFDNWSGYPNGFISAYPVVDGAFSWESAWPAPGTTISNVSDSVDANVLQQAHAAGKIYMMPLSSFQFKYLGSGQDWYRIGEDNMPQRMGEVLSLQPDLVEVLTWNDAGEGHYIGNFFQDQIAGSTIGDYADGFDHTGWQQLVTPFIKAYKAGATEISQIAASSPVGSLWYRTLMTSASCSSSIQNYQQGQDTVNFAVVLPSSGYTINVYSNSQRIGSFAGTTGLNYNAVPGLQLGNGQMIEILDSAGNTVASATGTKEVLAQSPNSTCNWNYEVVGLSS